MIKIIKEMFDETSNKCLRIYKGYTMITFGLLIVVAVICSIQGFTDNMWIVDETPLIDGLLILIVGIFAACAHLVINMLILQFLNNVQIIREKIEEVSQKEKE